LHKDGAAADVALRLGVTGDLLKGVSFGVTGYAVSALGLENNLVNNVWSGAHGQTAAATGVDDAAWISEMWLATSMGKTTAKVGRMELDTPLAFSESWSIAKNTFDAAVLLNQDLPDTTLVAAWVGRGNGVNHLTPLANVGSVNAAKDNEAAVGFDGMGAGAKMVTYGEQGAYAVAAINNSFKPLTAQAWYYNVGSVLDAYWLQADWDCQLIKDVKVGVQYVNIDPKGVVDSVTGFLGAGNAKDSKAYAIQLAYEGIQNLKLSAAYSDVDEDGVLNVANTSTNNTVNAQSKLYTEAAWGGNYGYVGVAGAESWNVKAKYDAGFAKFCASYTDVEINNASNGVLNNVTVRGRGVGKGNNTDMQEVALGASKSFGPLDTRIQYVSTDADGQNNGKRFDTVNAYLTLNF
jgi:hypothetical protein